MRIYKILFLILALFSLSCSDDLKFINPFDPSSDPSLWAPKNLLIEPQSSSSIKVSWTKVNARYDGFKISRKVGNGDWEENIVTVGTNADSWTDTDAPIGNIYIYRVRAYAGDNQSNAVEKTEVFVLSAPTNLSITEQSASSLKLTWTDTNQFEQGFKISRKVDNGAWQENIATVGVNILTWTDTNAPIGKTYTYRVRAYAGGNQSNAVEKTEAFVLSAPTNLSITPQSATSLKLTWADTNQFEQGFKISRKVDNGAWQENIATVGVNILTWTDTNAPYGTTYTYRVRAYAGANQSNAVEKTEAFVLSAPTNLLITSQSATSIKITWTDTNEFEEGYKISRKTENGDWEEDIATVDANITQWTDGNVNLLQSYQFRIRAYYQSHYSEYSITAILDLTNFVYVQGGTFEMGGNVYSNEQPIHSVTLSSFWIGKYELTQSEWQTVMTGNNNGISATPSSFSGNPNRPVESVSWYAAIVFCNRKSIQEGLTPCYAKSGNTNPVNWGTMPTSSTDTQWDAITCNWSANGYRLPTEAEWEYAARGGNKSKGYTYSGSNTVDNVAWCSSNSNSQTYDVGTKAPNELGIYDMSGNVWEWCWDWYSSSYYSSSPANNPTGPSSGSYRVRRGGSWYSIDSGCRVAYRSYNCPGNSYYYHGLRVLRTIQ